LVDVAVHAVLNPERLAGRGTRVLRNSGIEPGEAVEDGDGTDGFVNDVAAVGDIELLREGTHGAGLPLRIAGSRADTAFKTRTGRAMWPRRFRIAPVVEMGVGSSLDDLARIARVGGDLAPVLDARDGKVLGGTKAPVLGPGH